MSQVCNRLIFAGHVAGVILAIHDNTAWFLSDSTARPYTVEMAELTSPPSNNDNIKPGDIVTMYGSDIPVKVRAVDGDYVWVDDYQKRTTRGVIMYKSGCTQHQQAPRPE